MTGVPVLLYHRITTTTTAEMAPFDVHPALFAAHMQYLSDEGYEPIALGAYAASLKGTATTRLPPRPVIITFDDGFADFSMAAAILDEFGFPATVFVPTSYVGGQSTWLPDADLRSQPILSWEQLRALRSSRIEIGSHSHIHRPLDELTRHEIEREVHTSKQLLEQELDVEVNAFAYPHGYHDARVVQAVQRTGYRYACAVRDAMSKPTDDPYAISRLFVGWTTDVATLARLLEHGNRRIRSHHRVATTLWRNVRRTRHRIGVGA